MGFLDKAKAFFQKEGADLKEGLDSVKQKMDTELTKREQELAASPSERMEMMKDDIAATDARFDDLAEQVQEKRAGTAATAEVAGTASAPPATTADLPSVADSQAAAAEREAAATTATSVAPAVPTVPARPIGTANRSALLTIDDVPSADNLNDVRSWVTAELVVDGMPEYGQFDHAVVVNPPDDVVTSDAAMHSVAAAVLEHPLVKDGKYEGGRLFYFYATGLAPEDLSLLTASALAART